MLSSAHGQISKNWKTYLQESQGSSGIEFEQHGRAGSFWAVNVLLKKPSPKGDEDNK